MSKPPERAFWKAPLSYHFLASGSDGSVAAASTGRFRKVTTWVPLEKVQSVRRVQGPFQRAFNLASVYLDAAGRRVRAELRDREVEEADRLFEELVLQSRAARRRASSQSRGVTSVPASGPGADGASREQATGHFYSRSGLLLRTRPGHRPTAPATASGALGVRTWVQSP